MKIRDYILHVSLSLLVVISVVLTYMIWINPALNQRDQTTTTHERTDVAGTIGTSISDIYAPNSLVYSNNEGQLYQLTSANIDLLGKVTTQLQQWSPRRLKKETTSETAYRQKLHTKNALILNYAARINVPLFEKTLKKPIRAGAKNQRFRRVVVELNQAEHVYLLDDQTRTVYRFNLAKYKVANFRALLKDKQVERNLAEWTEVHHNYSLTYPKPVEVANYSYLVGTENSGIFVTRLLGSSSSNKINTKEEKEQTVYYDGDNQRMVVDARHQTVAYTNYGTTTSTTGRKQPTMSFVKTMTNNLTRLNALRMVLNDVRYDEYDTRTHTAIYRTYINSLPLISEELYGAYKMQQLDNNGINLTFSLYTFQAPLPAQPKTTTLISTRQLMQKLATNGYTENNISAIRLGYTWAQNDGSKMVIDMQPTYFIKYEGNWLDCQLITNIKQDNE